MHRLSPGKELFAGLYLLVLHDLVEVLHRIGKLRVFLHRLFQPAVARRLCGGWFHISFDGALHASLVEKIAGFAIPGVFAGREHYD